MNSSTTQAPAPPDAPRSVGATLRALCADSAVYLLGAAMLALASFVLVPLYTRFLTPAEFGVYALVDITVVILVLVTQMKLDVAYLRSYSELGDQRRDAMMGTVLGAGTTAAIFGGALLTASVALPFGRVWLQTADRPFAWTLLPLVVLETVQGFFLSDLRARRRPVPYCAGNVVRVLGMVAATFWFLAVRHQGVYGVFLGRLVGDVCGTLLLGIFCLVHGRPSFDRALLREMLGFSAPIVWGGLMMLLLDAMGRFFLSRHANLDAVGYYGVAIKISGVFVVAVYQPFAVAWGGLMFQVSKWPNGKVVYANVLTYVSAFALAVALGVVLFAPALFRMFSTPAYAPAMVVFPLIVLVRCCGVFEQVSAIGIYVAGRTKWFALIYTIGLAANLAANISLTPRYGILGAAAAWLIGWAAVNVLMLLVGQKLYRLQFGWKLVVLPAVCWGVTLLSWRHILPALVALHWSVQMLMASLVIGIVSGILLLDLRKHRHQLAF
jgi:O-antigen/teichoic acid export membrane protein